VRCGIPHALDRLESVEYLDAVSRHVVANRREIIASIEQVYTEADAVRASLLLLYLALPMGALSSDSPAASASASANTDSFSQITEPAGWNDVLDQAWRGAVYNATTPLQLMECALLLEHYLNKGWLAYPHSRLLSALPNPHFAVCNATYSSVALRVYCLDKAMLFNKVLAPPRERRTSQFDAYSYEEPTAAAAVYESNQPRARRAAAASATLRIQRSTVNYNEDSDEEDTGPSNVTTRYFRYS
jgi:hypothetical protein